MTTKTQQIPTGYKSSPLGPIPQDWEIISLGEIGETYSGLSGKSKEDFGEGSPYIPYMNIFSNPVIKDGNFDFVKINEGENQHKVDNGDIFFTTSSETPEEVGMCSSYGGNNNNLYLNSFCFGIRFKEKNKYSPIFLSNFFRSNFGRKIMYKLAQGATRYNLSKQGLLKQEFGIPKVKEQTAIATILSTVDTTIQQTQEIIRKLELRNKGLGEKLLSGKIRIKGFSGDPEFHILGKYITEISVKNRNNNVNTILSVTNSRGFINQSDQFEREIASEDKSNYKIVKKGQFAYNPSRVNVGSIDLLRNFEEGILSPMYVVFETLQDKLIPEFLYYHLKSHRFFGHIPMFVQGSVRDSLGFDGLSAMKFFIPSIEEQKKITEILDKATEEVKKGKQKLAKLQLLKKGLMQQLLTGKTRVNIK